MSIVFQAVSLAPGSWAMTRAMAQFRVIVLSFYVEEGRDAKDAGGASRPYRRVMGSINIQLVQHGFEVVAPFATDASEREFKRLMQRARKDSALSCWEMCKKYEIDAT